MIVVSRTGAAERAHERTGERPTLVVHSAENELQIERDAPVAFTTLEGIATAIERPVPPGASAITVMRPEEMIDYVLCVTDEGRLVVGKQVSGFDYAERRYTFVRGQLDRAYSPIPQPGPWKWLLNIPLNEDRNVTLVIVASAAQWPVETVNISPIGLP